MKRRKKSILFPATLATAGLVAGSLIVISNNTNAENYSAMSDEGLISALSRDLDISSDTVKESLATKTLIVQVKDENVLKNDPCLISAHNIYGNFYRINYDSDRETGICYHNLSREEAIENVSLNYIFSAGDLPTAQNITGVTADTFSAYRTTTPEGYSAWGVSSMMMDRYADDLKSSSNTIKVAVIDSGIRASHEIFSEDSQYDRLDLSLGINYVDPNNPTSNYADDYFHGTAVAGVIAESTPKNVKIVPIKILNSSGRCRTDSILEAVRYALRKGIKVINLSLGMEQSKMSAEDRTLMDDFFSGIESEGTIIVAAAGNSKESAVGYPAAAPGVIGVTSVNEDNSFSSQFSNYGSAADFSAPGSNLYYLPFYLYDDQYVVMVDEKTGEWFGVDGTSFSSPFVTAAVANILIEHPSFTKTQVVNELKLNAEDLGSAGWDQYYGYGSLSFHVNRYADITYTSVSLPSEWGRSASVDITAKSTNYYINKYILDSGNTSNTAPDASKWRNLGYSSKNVNELYSVNENGTYTLWYKNSNNEIKSKVFTVSSIDKVAPTINAQLSASKVSNTSEKLSMTVSDDASGISKIEWYYKASGASSYEKATDAYNGSTASAAREHTLSGLAYGSYTAYAVVYDRAGNSKTSNSVNFTLEVPADHITIGDPTGPTSWIKTDATITVAVSSDLSNVTHRAVVSGSSTTAPADSQWVAVSNPGKSFTDSFKVSTNDTYTVWYKNNTETKYKTFTVSKIDKTNPVAKNITVSSLTSSSAKLSAKVSDNASGIAKIEWKYKLVSASEYTTKISTYTDGATAEATKTYTLTDLAVGNYVVYATVYDNVGLTASTGEINFEIKEEPVITDLVAINSLQVANTWGKTNKVTVSVSSETSNITHRAVVSGNSTEAPVNDKWEAIATPSKDLNDTITVAENGTYTAWYKNESGEMAYESFTVSKVDTIAPEIKKALKATESVDNSVTLTISVDDSASGIAKIEWFYKLEDAENYSKEISANAVDEGILTAQAVVEKSITLSDLRVGKYVAYAKIYDNAGNTKNSEEISFTIQAAATEDPIDDPTDDPTDDPAEDPIDDPADDPTEEPAGVDNPKTEDGIMIISTIGGVILIAGAAVVAKLRRIR